MGRIDSLSHKFFEECPESYAELFNQFLFHEPVIDYRSLKPADIRYDIEDLGKTIPFYRDLLRFAEIRFAGKRQFMLLGIENSAYIDYKLPIQTMIYDALEYRRQYMSRIIHEGKQKLKGDEFMSGFPKDMFLAPVFTLVVNLSPVKWDGPTSLKQMIQPEFVDCYGQYINDYKVNLLEASDIDDKVLNYLSNDTRGLLGYIKYSNDKEGLNRFVHSHPEKNRIKPITGKLIKATTRAKINLEACRTEDGGVNMCIAIDEMLADTEREKQGRLQAIKRAESEKQGRLQVLKELEKSNKELEKSHNELKKSHKELEKSHSNFQLLKQMLNERGCSDEEISSYLNSNSLKLS